MPKADPKPKFRKHFEYKFKKCTGRKELKADQNFHLKPYSVSFSTTLKETEAEEASFSQVKGGRRGSAGMKFNNGKCNAGFGEQFY